MGRWEWHPMASDIALDFRDDFYEYLLGCKDYYKDDNYEEKIKEKLEIITVKELEKYLKKGEYAKFCMSTSQCLFTLPYVFAQLKVKVKDDVKEFLRGLLIKSIKHIAEYDSEFDYMLTNLLCFDIPKESELYFIYSQQVFLAHFDEVFDQKYDLDEDSGLVNNMISSSLVNYKGLFNKIELWEDWETTLEELVLKRFTPKECSFIMTLARNGDLTAKHLACNHVNLFKFTTFLIECYHDLLVVGKNHPYSDYCELLDGEDVVKSFIISENEDEDEINHYYKVTTFDHYFKVNKTKDFETIKKILEICAITQNTIEDLLANLWEFNEEYGLARQAISKVMMRAMSCFVDYNIEDVIDTFSYLLKNCNYKALDYYAPYNYYEEFHKKDLDKFIYFWMLYVCCYGDIDINKCDKIIDSLNDQSETLFKAFSDPKQAFGEIDFDKYFNFLLNNLTFTISKLEGYLEKNQNKDNVNKAIDLLKAVTQKITKCNKS